MTLNLVRQIEQVFHFFPRVTFVLTPVQMHRFRSHVHHVVVAGIDSGGSGVSRENALPTRPSIRGPVNTVMKNAAINDLGMMLRALQAVGHSRNMAPHFLPLIVMPLVNPYSRLCAKEKHIRIFHRFSITSVSEPVRVFCPGS